MNNNKRKPKWKLVLFLALFFKILRDRSILNFFYFDKIPTLILESRCFLQKPLSCSRSRFPSGNFEGYFELLIPLCFVP